MTTQAQDDLGSAELDRAMGAALRAAEKAMSITRSTPIGEVATKSNPADHVTAVDKAVERAVREIISAEFEDHVFVGEEYGGTAGDGPTWYCDPVDGTTNLAVGLPWTSFSLSLAIGRTPLVGVVADPWRNTIWLTAAGNPVLVNGEPHTLDPTPVQLTGNAIGTDWARHEPWPGMLDFLAELADRHCTTRIMGSSTLTLAQVAVGRTIGGVLGFFMPEDHLAATLLCQQAGLAVLNEDGDEDPFPESGGILVARREIADELYALWSAARS